MSGEEDLPPVTGLIFGRRRVFSLQLPTSPFVQKGGGGEVACPDGWIPEYEGDR